MKLAAWTRQHGALDAPGYRITLKSRQDNLATYNVGKGRGPDGGEKIYSAAEVADLIPYLSGKNANGRDVYVTPIDRDHHYLVVDDTTLEAVAEMKAKGFVPALVQESSAGNVQAIIRAVRVDAPGEQKIANRLVGWLNRQWGDPKFEGAIHPFRLAGFSNKKPGRDDAFTRIVEVGRGVCSHASALLDQAREAVRLKKLAGAPESTSERQEAPSLLPAPEGPADGRWDALRAREVAVVRMKGWTLDESVLDYRISRAMLAEGYPLETVAGAMHRRSPEIEDRHPDVSGYVDRTIGRAGETRSPVAPTSSHETEGPEGPI